MIGPPAAEDEVDRATVRQLADALAGVGRGARGGRRRPERVPAPGRGRRPAGRWCAVCAGCGPTRCAGCTCPPTARDRRGSVDRGRAAVPRCRRPTPRRSPRSGSAVRAVADRAVGAAARGVGRAASTAAARSRLGDLPDALDRAVASTDLGMDRKPLWWRAVGLLQWLLTAGRGGRPGLAGRRVRRPRRSGCPSCDYPMVGEVPLPTLLLLGGLLLGVLLLAAAQADRQLGRAARPAPGRAAAAGGGHRGGPRVRGRAGPRGAERVRPGAGGSHRRPLGVGPRPARDG